VIWDSLAIVEWLADKTGRARFWPEDEIARGMARSMAAEMHSSYDNLRRECPMNLRKAFPEREVSDDVRAELTRIFEIWAQARARHGGGGRICSARSARLTSCSRRSSPASSPTASRPALRRRLYGGDARPPWAARMA
jgi:glutathione S-transferase